MKKQITRFQHQVPQHYLRLWGDSTGRIWLHDFEKKENKPRATKSILGKDYFYENNPDIPDNEVEDYLSNLENEAAPLLKRIDNFKYAPFSLLIDVEKAMCIHVGQILSKRHSKMTLLNFISAQLVRTSRTVDAVEKSLENSFLPSEIKTLIKAQNRPYELVKLGMERLPNRLDKDYTIVISYTKKVPFVTSDHPVTETSIDVDVLPQTCFNVLHKNDTFISFPLSPNFHCFLIPNDDSQLIIENFYSTLGIWPEGVQIDSSIKWRKLQPALIDSIRKFQTGFGRKFLISCQDETLFLNRQSLWKAKTN